MQSMNPDSRIHFFPPQAYTEWRDPEGGIVMTKRHSLTVLSTVLLALNLLAACERSPESAGTGSTSGESAETAPIAGMYEVTGTTIETGTGQKREISGSVILAEDGTNYTATYHLSTVFEGEEGVLPAEVIGQGAGTIDGRMLRGEAETQLVISSVPGIDPAFAFIPRTTTTRLVSKSVTSIAADGSVEITIENAGAAGEAYRPTRTTLRGARTSTTGLPSRELPSVATAPPDDDE
jgi:hypothetical protein